MPRRVTGRYERTTVGGETVSAFVPQALPPADPPINLDSSRTALLRAAEQALVRLDLAGEMVPSLDWFIYAFVRKEAVLSSQIEGTQATLVDLLAYEADADAVMVGADVEAVCNYLDALDYARRQIKEANGLPLSMRLLNETHQRLLQDSRGAEKQSGEIRRTQNWIGGTRPGNAVYVPPPPHVLPDVLRAFETYLHSDNGLPPLLRAGLLHVQFETIHPYLDGNGRIGRLLVTLLLEHWRLLNAPLLYLSLFFKRHRDEYHRRLNAVRTEGDWEGWLDYFLEGVATIAGEAVSTARELFTLVTDDRRRLLDQAGTSVATLRLFESLPRQPIVSISGVIKLLGTSKPTASRSIETLEAAGVLVEMTGKKRDRHWAYQRYLDQLRVGTEIT